MVWQDIIYISFYDLNAELWVMFGEINVEKLDRRIFSNVFTHFVKWRHGPGHEISSTEYTELSVILPVSLKL